MKNIKTLIYAVLLSVTFCISAMAGEWKTDTYGWKYQNDDGSYVASSWKEISGKWYYFNEGGYMLRNAKTPDGYSVNESGEWIQPTETANEIKNADVKYIFEESGEWVKEGDIPEGEYIYYPQKSTKKPVVKGSSCIANNFNYMKLYRDDIVYPGTYVPVDNIGDLDIASQGMFKVGKDIKAGTYKLTSFKSDESKLIIPTCLVYNTIPSSQDEFAPQKNVDKNFTVGIAIRNTIEVKDGQYVQLIDCTADFVRP